MNRQEEWRWLDVLREEEISATAVHSAWDAKMVPSEDDRIRGG
jgi:hypothetical protein